VPGDCVQPLFTLDALESSLMKAAVRRLVFTTHVTSSVGWTGAVLVFLAMAIIGLTSQDAPTVRGVYLVMAPAAWFVLVPLAHASLLSGGVISLGTPWGLFRHYWVVSKLLITLFATVILLIYMGTFRQMAGVAADPVVELGLVRNPSPMVHSIGALILLLVATVLGVYKPFGMTAYGKRQQVEHPAAPRSPITDLNRVGAARWVYFAWIVVVGLILLFVTAHLVSGRFTGH
jgi:hypothetical protein